MLTREIGLLPVRVELNQSTPEGQWCIQRYRLEETVISTYQTQQSLD